VMTMPTRASRDHDNFHARVFKAISLSETRINQHTYLGCLWFWLLSLVLFDNWRGNEACYETEGRFTKHPVFLAGPLFFPRRSCTRASLSRAFAMNHWSNYRIQQDQQQTANQNAAFMCERDKYKIAGLPCRPTILPRWACTRAKQSQKA
jgi:hypothetical protein